jgi:uncharacterized delta-60 repeat protein
MNTGLRVGTGKTPLTVCWIVANLFCVAVAAPPEIEYQPQNQNVLLYQKAAFGVIPSGSAPFSYQWLKDEVPIAAGTNDQLVFLHPSFSDAGGYKVVVSSKEGSTTSSNVTLTVRTPVGGDVDYSFAWGGRLTSKWQDFYTWRTFGGFPVAAAAVQQDGRVVIAGSFMSLNDSMHRGIARLNSDGTTDLTFKGETAPSSAGPYCIAVQNDGKLLLGGPFTIVDGISRNRIARLNADGGLDDSFQNGLPGADGFVSSIALSNDKILIGGEFSSINGVSAISVARLNADGTLVS